MNMDRFQPPTAAEQNQKERCFACEEELSLVYPYDGELYCRECLEKLKEKEKAENE